MGDEQAADPAARAARAARWMPDLGGLRLLGGGRTAALLAPDAAVLWWCAPRFDDPPLCWRLLDPAGGVAHFPGWLLHRAGAAPAGRSARTVLRRGSGPAGHLQVVDSLLPGPAGGWLVRLLRLRTGAPERVEHLCRLGGFGAEPPAWRADGPDLARGRTAAGVPLEVRGGTVRVDDGVTGTLTVTAQAWTAVRIGVGDAGALPEDPEELYELVQERDRDEQRVLGRARLPRPHPERARDALAVLRGCVDADTGAAVASVTTSLPEAPGADRQFDYRYTWLRDASLSTAVAALLGRGADAERYLQFVLRAWGDGDLTGKPVVTAAGTDVPDEREVDGVGGWGGSRPVRTGNGAARQRQYDSPGLLLEALSVYLQVGGRLRPDVWRLVQRLADDTAGLPDEPLPSNGIWELREPALLVAGDLGRWLVLDRAVWIARIWRPWHRRGRWLTARDRVAARIRGALDGDGLLPQRYGDPDRRPDATALMAVTFGLLDRADPRSDRLVGAVLDRLGSGPYVYRYPPDGQDGFHGVEGAFLPMSFLAVTALATVGRVDEATERLDELCRRLPRLLAEEVDPLSGRLLGNTPLVWSHAELARALYVLDAARRRRTWGPAGLALWRIGRYLALRAQRHHD